MEVIVTVADSHLGNVRSVADALRGAGLDVTGVLESTGIVTGSADPGVMAALRSIQGVAAVELDQVKHVTSDEPK